MKTVSVGSRLSSNLPVFFVLAALGALYFYRRRGGSVRELIARGTAGLETVRSQINRIAPSADESTELASSSSSRKMPSVAPSASI